MLMIKSFKQNVLYSKNSKINFKIKIKSLKYFFNFNLPKFKYSVSFLRLTPQMLECNDVNK